MITRNRARKALAELQQQVPVQGQSAAFVKPQQSPERVPKKKSTSTASEQQQSAEGLAIIAKKMNVISLNSSSEEDSETDAIDLSESSQSVVDLSSSDDADDDQSDMSENEDREESNDSEEENRDQTKSTFSTPSRQLLAEEVAKIIRGGDVKKLKLDDCKGYLRNYGLRVTGTKPVLIDRIKQHVELKEGRSRRYDRSTFTINCTGDVCKGDVVVFNQKVYSKYSATAKSAKQAGSRTIAGRVVKESYGAQRQQHTFTVEVLWSTGLHPLPPMKPLLVKGRNLYKRKTFRQEWANEGERQRTLDEKHERGAAARQIRAVKQGRFKGRQGNAGRFGLEGLSRKQLANPYTDTLASEEHSNCSSGNVFQSAFSVHQFAAVGTSHHLVRHHTPTGANNVPLGRIRQFGLPSENGKIKEATGGATTSVDKHRQWFKPAPVLLPSDLDAQKQKPYEAQNTSSSAHLPGGSSISQSRPRKSTQSVSTQAPITISVSQEPSSTSGTTQSHNSKNASSLNRPSSSLLGRPVSPFPNRPFPSSDRPASPVPNRHSSTSLGRPMSPFPNRPFSTALGRPVPHFPNRRSSTSSGKLMTPFPNRHSSTYLERPVSPSPKRPSFPSLVRPASPCPDKPFSTSLGRPMSPFPNRSSSMSEGRPMSPFPNGHPSTYLERPVSPSPKGPSFPSLVRPASPCPDKPFSTSLGRPMSPFPNRSSSMSEGRPMSPFPKGHSSTSLDRPVSPFPNRPSSTSLGRPVSPFPNRPSGRTNFQDGFPCPTRSCTNRGSRYCSSGVCYYCCKTKGGVCRNPRHNPQFDTIQHESRTVESFHVDMFKVHQSYGQNSSRR